LFRQSLACLDPQTTPEALTQLTSKFETAAAIHYASGLWDALALYLDDGRIELDNLIVERALRSARVRLNVRCIILDASRAPAPRCSRR